MSEQRFDKAFEVINQMAREMGLPSIFGRGGSGRNRSSFIYYEPPKDWTKTVYVFGYTPWRTTDPETGKTGFFTLKYRRLKSGALKLVKSVRFGRRKIAAARAQKWHADYYRGCDKQ